MTEVYGGDEVNAAVIDTGAAWTRIGLAGGLAPTVTLPSVVCEQEGGPQKFGDIPTMIPRPNVEIKPLLSDSVPTDWDTVEKLWSSGLKEAGIEVEESPLLFTEQIWSTDEQRHKLLELALETLKTPAAYLIKSPVCSLFSAGRGSGLVVDLGHQTTSVTPITDGLALYKPMRRSRKAGEYLNQKALELLGGLPVPTFKIETRKIVGLAAAEFTEKNIETTKSFYDYQSMRVVQDFKESMAQISSEEGPTTKLFELPNGHSVEYKDERYTLGDSLFEGDDDDESDFDMDGAKLSPWSSKGVSQLVVEAINACDVDLRAQLANNIVITGGTSLLYKLTDKINSDVTNAFPGLKIRVHAPGNYTERKNSAWLGGSIVSSLGTFHQMWVSKAEYDEVGADQLIKKRFH